MRLVFVPAVLLSTPQQFAVFVNSWSFMITSNGTHFQACKVGRLLADLSPFLSGLMSAADQLGSQHSCRRVCYGISTPSREMEATSSAQPGRGIRLPALRPP